MRDLAAYCYLVVYTLEKGYKLLEIYYWAHFRIERHACTKLQREKREGNDEQKIPKATF